MAADMPIMRKPTRPAVPAVVVARLGRPTGAVSERKRAANRANARRSTGPRTAAGKARVAQNAVRHGLTRPVLPDPALVAAVETCARAICGLGPEAGPDAAADPALQFKLHLARRIAQAQAELAQVQRVRHDLVVRAFTDPNYRSRRLSDDQWRHIHNQPDGPVRRALIFAGILGELRAT